MPQFLSKTIDHLVNTFNWGRAVDLMAEETDIGRLEGARKQMVGYLKEIEV
jgi:hypothetical protein